MDRLRFDNISFGYGDRTLFEGLSLDIKKARITSIIGPNGCGKSSLLKLASAIHKPWEGEISVFERKVGELRPKQRAQLIGHLSQEHSMPPMSVRKLIECGRHPHQGPFAQMDTSDKEIVEEALSTCGLSALAERPVPELSGGQRQRAFIAMIVAQDAPVMLLDEPTSFLDVSACYEVMDLMRLLRDKHGKTIVTVLHDIDMALRYSDEICVMREGRLLAQGTPCDHDVLDGIEAAFDVRIEHLHGRLGSAYALFNQA